MSEHATGTRAAKQVRWAVYRRDGNRCRACSRTWALTLHHLKPRRDGGEDTEENMVVLCRECHDLADEGWLLV